MEIPDIMTADASYLPPGPATPHAVRRRLSPGPRGARDLRRSLIGIALAVLRARLEQTLVRAGEVGALPDVVNRRLDLATVTERIPHVTRADWRGRPRADTAEHSGAPECR